MHLSNIVVHGGNWVFTNDDYLDNVTIYEAKIFFNCNKAKLHNVSIYSSHVVYNTDDIELQDSKSLIVKNCRLYSAAGYIMYRWSHDV